MNIYILYLRLNPRQAWESGITIIYVVLLLKPLYFREFSGLKGL